MKDINISFFHLLWLPWEYSAGKKMKNCALRIFKLPSKKIKLSERAERNFRSNNKGGGK